MLADISQFLTPALQSPMTRHIMCLSILSIESQQAAHVHVFGLQEKTMWPEENMHNPSALS